MTGQQRSDYIIAIGVELARQKPKRLWRVSKTMQEENSMRIPLLHIDLFGAGNCPDIDRLL